MFYTTIPSDLFSLVLSSLIVHCWGVFVDWKFDYYLYCWWKNTTTEENTRHFQPRKLNSGKLILWQHFTCRSFCHFGLLTVAGEH